MIGWPWWLHPMWVLILLTGTMALLSVTLPAELYEVWLVPKFITGDLGLILLINLGAMVVGIAITSPTALRGGKNKITINARQQRYLRRAYRLLFTLTVVGYVIWAGSAFLHGVSLQTLVQVLQRDEGAIAALKANARPISGITTLTQFGPVVVALGALLRRIGLAKRRYLWMLVFALVRTVFYAERLALIEVLVPLLIIWALTAQGSPRRRLVARLAPLLAVPLLWVLFAASEYNRSWIYYQQFTSLPFSEWVTLRLLGYYTTSFNNSALLDQALRGSTSLPYFSIQGFWSAPGVSLFAQPSIGGFDPDTWWSNLLIQQGNPNFNNQGSFLVTYAEFGAVGSFAFWLVLGMICGLVFATMTRGSVPALLGVASLFVGILELSRIIYWTQGRSFPIFVALIVIMLTYPRRPEEVPLARRRLVTERLVPVSQRPDPQQPRPGHAERAWPLPLHHPYKWGLPQYAEAISARCSIR